MSEQQHPPGRMLSGYGVGSAALGLVAVAALVLGAVLYSAHRDHTGERAYQSRVLQAALDWTSVFINMNTENVDDSLHRLHDGTAGELNAQFDAAVAPYRRVVQKLKSHSVGRVEAVAIETARHDDSQRRPPAATDGRVAPVLVVATSVAENVSGKPQTVHWNLRLGITEVAGALRVCALESLR